MNLPVSEARDIILTDDQIAKERDQLVGHWKAAVAKRRDWTTYAPIKSIFSIVNGTPSPRASRNPIRDLLREFHNELGYKALNGGLCAGAIFRTQSFIDTRPRIGSKHGQTVHIEHTVPVCVLDSELKKLKFLDHSETLVWVLKHSVATAFRKSDEAKYLKGVRNTTNAFSPNPNEENKPFLRYKQLFADNGVVWNVFDREKIEPNRFTFDDHVDVIVRLLRHVGAEQRLIDSLCATCCEDGDFLAAR
jgi:hypothetical protein